MAKYNLDLTKTLAALDMRKKDFYDTLTSEEKKAFQPYVMLRYMSSVPDKGDLPYLALYSTNQIANKHFWELTKEPELQAKLLALCGLGSKQYHKWIPAKTKRSGVLNSFIYDIFDGKNWHCNSYEIQLYLNLMTEDDLGELCDSYGKTKEERKKIIEEFRKLHL
jgi:hypothetical protein